MNKELERVMVIGGAGYVGSALVPSLLKEGYQVKVFDTYWYGDVFNNEIKDNLLEIKGDIRDKEKLIDSCKNTDAIIHLACISNDPSFDALDPALGKSINYDAFFNILNAAKENNVKRLIYASSSSVYGLKEEKNVIEKSNPNPLTDYSKYKLMCEEELNKLDTDMEWVIARPATVCGYSPRVRLDVVVNILTINALENKKVKVFGTGENLRPNINIKDMVRAYQKLLVSPKNRIDRETFNIGYHNLPIKEIAELVRDTIPENIELEYVPTDDNRSYHINSDKIARKLNFSPLYDVKDAIETLVDAHKNGLIVEGLTNPLYHNIKRMKELNIS